MGTGWSGVRGGIGVGLGLGLGLGRESVRVRMRVRARVRVRVLSLMPGRLGVARAQGRVGASAEPG